MMFESLASTTDKSCINSSQTSYYDGDNELKEILENMDFAEVEHLLDGDSSGKPSTTSTTSSSGSLSSITSESTLATFTASNTDRTLKRKNTVDDYYPCRRSKLSTDQKDKCAFQEDRELESPIPRSTLICNPGHGSSATSTVNAVSVGGPDHTVTTIASSIVEIGPNKRRTASRVQTSLSGNPSFSTEPTSHESSLPLPVIIAHDEGKQMLMDQHKLAKGVQYEIARGITRGWWTWDEVTEEVVELLRGSNSEKAGKVSDAIGLERKDILNRDVIESRQAIYAELDREHEAFLESKGRGLGLMGPWRGEENWFGGCVQLSCTLKFNDTTGEGDPPFSICLDCFGIGKSNRAARRVTSLSILQLKIKGAMYNEKRYKQLTEYLSRDLVICGRRYVAFCSKQGKVFFVETKDDFQRKARRSMGDHFRLSYKRFVNAINPMGLNENQAMSKWLSRWQLILSTSRPVVEFEPENIHIDIEDIYGAEDRGKTESVMTDGCGLINLTALRLIATNTGSTCPVVVQGRIAGAKGLWLLHPSPEHRRDTEPPIIWIRRSQLKIDLPNKDKWDRSLRIFDLLRLPRSTVPSGLNMQTIMNMSHNGVRDEIFVSLMEAGLKKKVDALTKWDGDNACIALAKAVEDAGGLMASRRTRAAGSDARLYSYARDESDDEDEDDGDGDNDDDVDDNGLVERDYLSGYSPSLYESARDMLLAGFTPLKNEVLREKLKCILKQARDGYLEKFRIPVPASAQAFIAPDPYGVLEEGQIYFRCSTPISDPSVCIDPHTFLGPVLVTRNPTGVASDIQKVTAVRHDRLLSYTDVIIFSVKGERSLASYLGGGDYDGDTVTVIAEPALVTDFENSPLIPEPSGVRESFEQEIEKVSEFLGKVDARLPVKKYREVSKKVLQGLSDRKHGLYSKMHGNCVYELGYNSPTAVRLAYMFTTCLDAAKSGLRIKGNIFREDSLRWNADRPYCMQNAKERSRIQRREPLGRPLSRPEFLGPFIFETLREAGKKLGDRALHDFEEVSTKAESSLHWSEYDEDLSRPYDQMKRFAGRLKSPEFYEELEKIEVFVRLLCDQYISEVGLIFGNRNLKRNGSMESTSRENVKVARVNHEYSRRFRGGPACSLLLPEMAMRAKASYAYIYGAKKSKLGKEFGFVVASDLLCSFKSAGASISPKCRDFLHISGKLLRLVTGE